MRVTMLIGAFPPNAVGGAEIQAQEWATRLAEDHQVCVVTRRAQDGQAETEKRAGFDIVNTSVSPVPGWRTIADIAAIGAAVRAMPAPPDLLLCFQTFVSGLAGVHLQSRLGVPAVVWIRGEWEYRLQESLRSRLVSPRVWDRARAVLVQSEANRLALLARVREINREMADRIDRKLRVVPNGIALPAEPVRPGSKVLVLGRLIPQKGVDIVIEAMAGIARVTLLIVGDGPERPRLEALAAARKVDTEFLGNVTREHLPGVFAQAACIVLASRSGEGFPNVLLEAMASGVPVVATPVAGITDLVGHGRNGLLSPPGDHVALRATIVDLLSAPELRARLAARGRETAAEYSWDRVRPVLESVLADVAGTSGR